MSSSSSFEEDLDEEEEGCDWVLVFLIFLAVLLLVGLVYVIYMACCGDPLLPGGTSMVPHEHAKSHETLTNRDMKKFVKDMETNFPGSKFMKKFIELDYDKKFDKVPGEFEDFLNRLCGLKAIAPDKNHEDDDSTKRLDAFMTGSVVYGTSPAGENPSRTYTLDGHENGEKLLTVVSCLGDGKTAACDLPGEKDPNGFYMTWNIRCSPRNGFLGMFPGNCWHNDVVFELSGSCDRVPNKNASFLQHVDGFSEAEADAAARESLSDGAPHGEEPLPHRDPPSEEAEVVV